MEPSAVPTLEGTDHTTGTFSGAGHLALFFQRWRPQEAPVAAVGIVHGVGEHSGRYPAVVAGLLRRRFAVYGFDHRGHGRSPGRRGHVRAWSEYRHDVRAFVRLIGDREPGRRVFLYAHSMGALIALDYLPEGQHDLAGAVISGAPIAPVGIATPALVALARLLSKVWPAFPLRPRLRAEALSRDPEVVLAYRADPLVHGIATPRWGTEALDAVRRLHADAPRITLPLLFVHGGGDRLNDAGALGAYIARLGSTDTTLRIYPGSFHEPHNDLDRAQVVADVGEWIEQRIGPPTAGIAPGR